MRIVDVETYQKIAEYIRKNPIARRLMWDAGDFPYSTARAEFQLDPPQGLKPVFSPDLGGTAKAEA